MTFSLHGIDNDPQQPASDVSADVLEAHGNASPLYEPPNEAASVGLCSQNDSLYALNHSWNETDNSEWRSSGESVDDSSSEYSSGESSSLDEDDGQDERTDQQEQTKMDDPLYPGARISKAESVLLIMARSLRHSASKEATESVLKLVEVHLPDGTGFPSTNKIAFLRKSDGKGTRNTVGCIDGSHIEVLRQDDSTASYINRKKWSSIILQAVCNDQNRF
ncbi:hypothetical protein HPB49_013196 [Dermacentor silvarum]|uniref:Uncharacterized protein n=1 Tax=Dermacentor silvarum TaxID=543639 RepID=A0ACB8CXN7_DERSI|nr:hypothetical protein HPB49_013196 [Dermacentor silvarum]